MKRLIKIRKIILLFTSIFVLSGCTDDENTTNSGLVSEISSEVNKFFNEGQDANYKNLTFDCKSAYIPEGDYIYKLSFNSQVINGIPVTQENIEKLTSMVKGIIDYEGFDENKFYFHDLELEVPEIALDDEETLSKYETCPVLFYSDYDNYKKVEVNGFCIYATKGKIGRYIDAHNAFLGLDGMSLVKEYNCVADDLSDKYELIDGEISILEAKNALESYFNNLDVCGNKSGKIKDYMSEIGVYKLDSEDINIIHATRTFAYNNIPFRTVSNGSGDTSYDSKERAIMAEAYMIESSTVDDFLGEMNTYIDVKETEKYENIKNFSDIVTSVSTYLAGQSIFDVKSISFEYRLFTDETDYGLYAVPYWKFETENQTDKKKTIVYVDLKTGETFGFTLR